MQAVIADAHVPLNFVKPEQAWNWWAQGIRIAPQIVVDKTWHPGYDDLSGKRIDGAGSRNVREMPDRV